MSRSRSRNRNRSRSRQRQPRWTNRISEHFSKRDFSFKTEEGSDKIRISLGLVGSLELLRAKAKNRITIVLGYMTPEAAEKLGNWKRNYHPMGLAADIRIDNMSLQETFLLAESIEEFKGIGLSIEGDHVHVDTRKSDERTLWVEDKGDIIPLTDDLREKYGLVPPVTE